MRCVGGQRGRCKGGVIPSALQTLAPPERRATKNKLYVRREPLETSRAARETAASRLKGLGPTRLTLSKFDSAADSNDFPPR